MAGLSTSAPLVLTCETQGKVDFPALLDAFCIAVGQELSATYPRLKIDRTKGAKGDIRMVIDSANERRFTAFMVQSANRSETVGPSLGYALADHDLLDPDVMSYFAALLIEGSDIE